MPSISPLLGVLSVLFAQEGTLVYAEAYRMAVEQNRPLVVLVGAEWCPACKLMERQLFPFLRQRKLLGKIAFVVVDLDRDGKLGQQLVGDGPIPQLLMFRRWGNSWRMVRLIGVHDPVVVENQILKMTSPNSASLELTLSPRIAGAPPVVQTGGIVP
jgi:thiol-disulfide isomerase/thioredoxin